MPTCKKCNFSKSGKWFKNKICPECNELQEIDITQFDFDINDETDFNNSEELLIKPTEALLEDSYEMITEESLLEDQEKEITIGEPLIDKTEKEKFSFSKKTWLIMVARIYKTLDKMLYKLNPTFYASDEAKELRDMNAEIMSMVLEEKEVNPILLLILGNLLYISPAIVGLFSAKDEELTEELQNELVEIKQTKSAEA